MAAAANGRLNAVKMLLEAGADPYIQVQLIAAGGKRVHWIGSSRECGIRIRRVIWRWSMHAKAGTRM